MMNTRTLKAAALPWGIAAISLAAVAVVVWAGSRKARSLREEVDSLREELVAAVQARDSALGETSTLREELTQSSARLESSNKEKLELGARLEELHKLVDGLKAQQAAMRDELRSVERGSGAKVLFKAQDRSYVDMWIASSGEILALHSEAGRVDRYDPDGKLIGTVTLEGLDPLPEGGSMNSLALDRDSNIYVGAGTWEGKVPALIKFDREGKRLASSGRRLPKIKHLRVGRDGTVYGLIWSHLIVFDENCKHREGLPLKEMSGNVNLKGFALNQKDRLLAFCVPPNVDWSPLGVVIFRPDGEVVRRFGRSGREPWSLGEPGGLAWGREGRLYVLGSRNLRAFDANGLWLGSTRAVREGRRLVLHTGWAYILGKEGRTISRLPLREVLRWSAHRLPPSMVSSRSPHARYMKAFDLYRRGEYAAALEAVEKLPPRDYRGALLAWTIGRILWSNKELEGAERALKLAARRYPLDRAVHDALVEFYMNTGRPGPALKAFDTARRLIDPPSGAIRSSDLKGIRAVLAEDAGVITRKPLETRESLGPKASTPFRVKEAGFFGKPGEISLQWRCPPCFLPDGRMVVAGEEGLVQFLDPDGKLVKKWNAPFVVSRLAATAEGNLLLVPHRHKRLGKSPRPGRVAGGASVTASVGASGDQVSKAKAVGLGVRALTPEEVADTGMIRVVDLDGKERFAFGGRRGKDAVFDSGDDRDIFCRRDGTMMSQGGRPHRGMVFGPKGELIRKMEFETGGKLAFMDSAENIYLIGPTVYIGGTRMTRVHVYDRDGELRSWIATTPPFKEGHLGVVAVNDVLCALVREDDDCSLAFFNTRTGKLIGTYRLLWTNRRRVPCWLAFDPKGRLLAGDLEKEAIVVYEFEEEGTGETF